MDQLFFDDVNGEIKVINPNQYPRKIAFIDESGGFGFDFTKKGTGEFFVICAIIIEEERKKELEKLANEIKVRYFGKKGEMKSSVVGGNVRRRRQILNELIHVDFKAFFLIVDKQKLKDDSNLKLYKPVFLKYLHNILYQKLYSAYNKLSIYFDETGDSEFQKSFRKYVESNRPQYNLFNEYDFDFKESKGSVFIQVVDFLVGTISRSLLYPNETNYQRIIKGNTLNISYFPEKFEDYLLKASKITKEKFNKEIYHASYNCAKEFIGKNSKSDDENVQLQVRFVEYLLFYSRSINPNSYVHSKELLNILNEYSTKRIIRDYFYRRIVAPIRDSGVIIASSSQGYKIPICEKDIYTYINQTSTVVAPMLRRLGICRDQIIIHTEGKLDILDRDEFMKYKKYFD